MAEPIKYPRNELSLLALELMLRPEGRLATLQGVYR